MITTSILSIVILIFVLHTVLTHLFNWWFRECLKAKDVGLSFFTLVLIFIEMGVCILLLKYYIS